MAVVPEQFKNPRTLAANFNITFQDVFNAFELYKMINGWLDTNNWLDRQTGESGGKREILFSQKVNMYGQKEILVLWRQFQWPGLEGGNNDFFKYHMDIDMQFLYLKDTEIMFEGKKVKTNTGLITIKIWSWIEADYNQEWSKHPFLVNFIKLFRTAIFGKEANKYKYELYRHTFTLHSEIKKFLKLKGRLPKTAGISFDRPYGVESV